MSFNQWSWQMHARCYKVILYWNGVLYTSREGENFLIQNKDNLVDMIRFGNGKDIVYFLLLFIINFFQVFC